MTTNPDGGHAYPTNAYRYDESGNAIPIVGPGMTLRDRIAIAAMQSIIGWSDGPARNDGETFDQAAARLAVQYADALIAELEKSGQ